MKQESVARIKMQLWAQVQAVTRVLSSLEGTLALQRLASHKETLSPYKALDLATVVQEVGRKAAEALIGLGALEILLQEACGVLRNEPRVLVPPDPGSQAVGLGEIGNKPESDDLEVDSATNVSEATDLARR